MGRRLGQEVNVGVGVTQSSYYHIPVIDALLLNWTAIGDGGGGGAGFPILGCMRACMLACGREYYEF